jgi:hypothetical protein
MSPPPDPDTFRYEDYLIDPGTGTVQCTYSAGGHTFTERYAFDPQGDWDSPGLEPAVRLLFLLAGVSYYKTTAASVVDLGTTPTDSDERAFLESYYREGLAEFAYRNHIDLGALSIVGPDEAASPSVEYQPRNDSPLIPFGGGIDSIVTVESLKPAHPNAALCIVHPPGQRFAAIETAADRTGLALVHVARELDPKVRRSEELGFLNGHVPVTAVITAVALVAAVLDGRDAVVLSNEWSASIPTLVVDGRPINHQWSKGEAFEQGFGNLVARHFGPRLSVFSYLRPRSELWVAEQFARLTSFHGVFRSCNRAFHQESAERLDQWCGVCDKCCFIDLILAPFMSATALGAVFGGTEPLARGENAERFRTLVGLTPDPKPFECVGDVNECRAAVLLAAAREDRSSTALLQSLRVEIAGHGPSEPAILLAPMGPHYIPERYVPTDLLVRAH